MRIVLTGAAGLLGCHFAVRLLRDGQQVIGVGNLIIGSGGHTAWLQEFEGFSLGQRVEQEGVTARALI